MQLSLAAIFLGLTVVSAAPTVVTRDEPADCGGKSYTAQQVSNAIDEGCSYFESGSDVNSYPHRYNNYEGFDFKGLDGPFQEFPIISGGVYTGGSPGADRVVFTEDSCALAGTITHTGASGNAFVACVGTS
ncbi:Guanyl-specific ribonuclease F1-like protein [Emericellopsis cladophorae]|uniref:ribonuclease T1 n=1 Tax=Emericellopsis cladophorae TaxID=2686198 RepID=A0A9Q0BEQ6_9HYPO|nr:Guanyl-specific ribonuclease F1-like protein [Emericellopsis cladophorae]KAI6781489.1 Guanyl-specific ribonuclease F1-like protein [Emericellopsis cladophorae]